MRKTQLALAIAALGFMSSAHATNGMNLEGYGPIATGMGGASFAYDNGTAAVMNNPATLGLMANGSRLDLAVGMLGPDVKNETMGQSSDGDAYFMPAVGWIKKDGKFAYGFGLFGQGGMGTEYDQSMIGDGMEERSELGVGRFIVPLAYNVTPDLTIAGSVDFVWAMLDIKMAMGLGQMAGLITNGGNGTITGALNNFGIAGYTNARLDFSDENDFTGRAKGTGFAGKLGFTYKATPTLTIGGTYHSKTNLDDLETNTGGADMILTGGGNPLVNVAGGKLKVNDFQWPETYGMGVAFQATPKLLLALDVKHIGWKDVMEKFSMTYENFGDAVTFELDQDWDDQTVFQFGVAYQYNDKLTLRAGANIADNPIPDATMHYLFPAIVEEHYTLGFGYAFDKISDVNFSMQYAPEVDQTNSTFGYKVSHSQLSWQLMYSHRF